MFFSLVSHLPLSKQIEALLKQSRVAGGSELSVVDLFLNNIAPLVEDCLNPVVFSEARYFEDDFVEEEARFLDQYKFMLLLQKIAL